MLPRHSRFRSEQRRADASLASLPGAITILPWSCRAPFTNHKRMKMHDYVCGSSIGLHTTYVDILTPNHSESYPVFMIFCADVWPVVSDQAKSSNLLHWPLSC